MDNNALATIIADLERMLASPGALMTGRVRDHLERHLAALRLLLTTNPTKED